MNHPRTQPPPTADHDRTAFPRVRSVDSEELLGDSPELQIVHRGEVYRLRLTRAGKLILHK